MSERIEHRRVQQSEIDSVRDDLTRIVQSSEGTQREKRLHAYVRRRIADLESRIRPVELKATRETQCYDGFLHAQTIVYPTQDERIPGFSVDHPRPYEELVRRLIGGAKLTAALQETIDVYFGKLEREEKRSAQTARERYYTHRGRTTKRISLNEFWDRKMAMCLERAALAQNLLTFLGHRSAYVGGYVRFERGTAVVEEGFHAWNLVRKEDGSAVLYDPNNPTEHGPALYALGVDDAERMRRGQSVVIERDDERLAYNAPGGEKFRR